MPLYEYECEACGRRFEKIQKFSDPSPDVCVHCGKGPVRKLPSSPAIQFKGSGFYITDYARKSSSEAGSKSGGSKDTSASSSSSSSSSSGATETKSSESKPGDSSTTTKKE